MSTPTLDRPTRTLSQIEAGDPSAAEKLLPLVYDELWLCLHMTFREIAEILGVSADTAEADWAYARAWIQREYQAS